MTAGTHLAGAALTASLLRGFGVEVGLLEGLALAWGSVMPDMDTITSGPGKFLRPSRASWSGASATAPSPTPRPFPSSLAGPGQ